MSAPPPPSHPSPPPHPAPSWPVWTVLPDPAAVGDHVAALLLHELTERPGRPLGLATGRTMEPVYRAVVRRVEAMPAAARHDLLRRWSSFNLDEYVGLGGADSGSFAREMAERLGLPLGLDAARLRLPDGLAPDPEVEARRYADEVAAAGGIGLQLLGLGRNGHVAFNEPPCGPEAPCRVVTLAIDTRRRNALAAAGRRLEVPERAITLGMREILAAERILLVVTGQEKAAVLRRALREPPTADLPASWLQRHPALAVVVDEDAVAPGVDRGS